MGIFDNIGKAEYFESGKYVTPGLYLTEIQKVKQAKTRNGRPFFVVEMKVLESSSLKEHPVSTDMTWMVMLDQDAALGNIKHFLSVASDVPMGEITPQDAEESCAEENPLSGVKVRLMAVNILTRAKKDFTKVRFMPESMSAAAAAAAHAEEVAAAAAPAAAAPATA